MNRKGFTLVELIATISILLLITVIAVPTIITALNNKEKDECESYADQFKTLAELYVSDHKNEIIKKIGDDTSTTVTLKELQNGDYLNEIPKNPMTGTTFGENETVQIIYENGIFTYKYIGGGCN